MAKGGGKSGLLASSATPHLIFRHQCARTRNFNTKHTMWFITALFDIFLLFYIYDSVEFVIPISHDKPNQSPSTQQMLQATAPEKNVIKDIEYIAYIHRYIFNVSPSRKCIATITIASVSLKATASY